MKLFISIAVLTGLVSCAPAPEIKKRAPLFKTEERLVVLSEKADKEVIISKYKNSINLRCDFMIDNQEDANITNLSGSGFTVNLANSEAPTNLVFKMNNGQVFTVGMQVKTFDILPEMIIPHVSGSVYQMKQTPFVELIIRGRDVHGKKDKRYEKSMLAYENIPVAITDLFPKKYPHFMKCELQTVIAKAFEDQYVIILPTKEDSPATEVPSETAPVETVPEFTT